MKVKVNTSEYRRSYCTEPKGRGNWAFRIGGELVFIYGKYADARKAAVAMARESGVDVVYTLP